MQHNLIVTQKRSELRIEITSVVDLKLFFPDPDPDPTLTLISDPDSNLDPDPACL
jgi:hypothetical protein